MGKGGRDATRASSAPSRYTPTELAECNTRDNLKLSIRGKVYDLTSWQQRHPGGSVMLRLAAGRDATLLFDCYHPDPSKIEPMLDKFAVGTMVGAGPLPQYAPMGAFYKDLKVRASAFVAKSGKDAQWSKASDQLLRIAVISALILGFQYAALSAPTVGIAVLLATVSGISRALSGVHILHDSSHAALTKNPSWHAVVGAYGNDVINGASYFLWLHQHIITHHLHCNHPGIDGDIDAGPIMRFHDEEEWKPWHPFQWLYAVPLYSMLGFFNRFGDITNFLAGTKGVTKLMPPTKREKVAFWGGKAAFFGYQCVVPMILGYSFSRTMLVFLASDLLGSVYLALMFQCSHVAEDVSFQSAKGDWAVEQVNTTQDYGHGSTLTYLMSGGLNYQVVHHLLPGISQFHYCALQPTIAQTCKDHGVKYRCLPTLGDAVKSHIKQLYILGQKPKAA